MITMGTKEWREPEQMDTGTNKHNTESKAEHKCDAYLFSVHQCFCFVFVLRSKTTNKITMK